jgi:MinD-like ATPase involved in chromosome partitioning or flagellar assembly
MKEPGLLVTFYSYKGGVGRTMALANVGALLAICGYRTLCVDWDLEAPGLSVYFRQWMKDDRTLGFADLLDAILSGRQPNWREHLTHVALPTALGSVSLIHAGSQDGHYLERVQGLNWEKLYLDGGFGNITEQWRNEWKQEFDFILVDSRTGITDTGGICTIQLPDILVLVLTANQQSIEGSVEVAAKVTQVRSTLPFDRGKLPVVPVLSRLETRLEYDLAQEWLLRVKGSFEPHIRAWSSQDVDPESIVRFLRIPSIPYWSFGEELPVVSKGTSDPEDIGYAYENLAALLSRRLSGTETLPQNRDAFVASARLTPTQLEAPTTGSHPSEGALLFVVYHLRDTELAEELSAHLSTLRRSGLIKEWYDRRVFPDEWTSEISLRLEQADVILLLISADFLASEYCTGQEMRRVIERGLSGTATVIPVILRPVDWSLAPFSYLQTLPESGQPISTWTDRDMALVNVVQGLRLALESRLSLRGSVTRKCISMPMENVGQSMWSAKIEDADLQGGAFAILSVRASNSSELELVARVPYLVKVASPKFVPVLLKQALPGLSLQHMVVLPAPMQMRSGTAYFSLGQSGPVWEDVVRSKSIALYSPGEIVNPKWDLHLLY